MNQGLVSRSEMASTRDFWDASPCGTRGSLQNRLEWLFSMEPWVKAMLEQIAANHPHVVEVGCGQGIHAHYLCSRLPNTGSYLGLDYSPESIRTAIQINPHPLKLNVHPKFEVGDAENLPFENSSVEFLLSNGVLHHTSNDRKAFAEVTRVLKPGGKALITLYRYSPKVGIAKLCRGIQRILDKLFSTEKCLLNIIQYQHFPEKLGTLLLEGFGVPYLRWYSRKELNSLFPGLTLTRVERIGYNIPHINPKGSGFTPLGYMWWIELEKPK